VNLYATLPQLKQQLQITATDRDAYLLGLLEAVSREADQICNRLFYVEYGRRDLRPSTEGRSLVVPDTLQIVTLALDDAWSGTATATVAANHYTLEPNVGYPKRMIVLGPWALIDFSPEVMVLITGWFGYGDGRRTDPFDAASGTVTMTDSATSFTVTAGTEFTTGQTVRVEDELMAVTGVSTNTVSVTRGINGTTAAAHDSKAIRIAAYPLALQQAVLDVCARVYRVGAKDGIESETVADYTVKFKTEAGFMGQAERTRLLTLTRRVY